MNTKDLMIGDWVRRHWTYTDTGREVVRDFRLTEVRKYGETMYVCGDNGNMGAVEQIVPIPLTPEILEKNGWIHDNVLHNWWNDGVEFFIWYTDDGVFFCQAITSIKLAYVHNLQHLLRLCGIEKEIEL